MFLIKISFSSLLENGAVNKVYYMVRVAVVNMAVSPSMFG